jgi:vacuolar protein sorting-associated protein 53
VLDLKGTPKPSQNSLLDSFLTITSTQNELQTTSFLSALDMDPPAVLSATTSGINTPTGIQSPRGGEGLLGVVGSPPRVDTPPGGVQEDATRAVFPDFKRLVTFGLRRETMG